MKKKLTELTNEDFERLEKNEGVADFLKIVGLAGISAGTAMRSITIACSGGLIYAVGNMYNRYSRHTKERYFRNKLEGKVEDNCTCKSCHYKNKL